MNLPSPGRPRAALFAAVLLLPALGGCFGSPNEDAPLRRDTTSAPSGPSWRPPAPPAPAPPPAAPPAAPPAPAPPTPPPPPPEPPANDSDDDVALDPAGAGDWAARLELTLGAPATSGLGAWTPDFDAAPLALFDFDGDGLKEVVAHGNDSRVYVFHSKTGEVLARLNTTIPDGWGVERVLNAAAVGRLAPGQPPSIVVTNPAAFVAAWRYAPTANATGDFPWAFEKLWERHLPELPDSGAPSMDAAPALADLDGDGELEVVLQTESVGVFALRGDGTTMWSLAIGGGNAEPVVGDVDDDGEPEVLFASDAGILTAVEGRTGKIEWGFEAFQHAQAPASIPVGPTIADLDGKAPPEMLFAARDAHDTRDYANDHVTFLAIHVDAGTPKLVWKYRPLWAAPLAYAHLAVADVTGDGRPEVFGIDWNTIGHVPGEWQRTGPAHVFSLSHDGKERWMREVEAWWSNKEVAIADVDGDGAYEVLVNGPRSGRDGLWAFDARTGRAERFLPVAPWKVERGPQLADLWGQGTIQLLLSVRPVDDARRGGILVFDLEKPWDAPWPGAPPAT